MKRYTLAVALLALLAAAAPRARADCSLTVIAYGWTFNEVGMDTVSVRYSGVVVPIMHHLQYVITWRWSLEEWDGQHVVPLGSQELPAGSRDWSSAFFGSTIIDPRWDSYLYPGTAGLWTHCGSNQHAWGRYWITYWHQGGCQAPLVPASEPLTPETHVYGPGFFH